MIQKIEYLAVVPNPSVQTNATIVLVEDMVLDNLFIFGIRYENGVIAGNSDTRVAQFGAKFEFMEVGDGLGMMAMYCTFWYLCYHVYELSIGALDFYFLGAGDISVLIQIFSFENEELVKRRLSWSIGNHRHFSWVIPPGKCCFGLTFGCCLFS